ncbi:MAG: hypothetical protein GY765_38155 [bacterium]|nr:hypothetical protein [bacterium]
MKRSVMFVLVLMVIGFAFTNLSAQADPDLTFSKATELRLDYQKKLDALCKDITLDYHPKYGTVKIADMPMYKGGWKDSLVPGLFPDNVVTSYKVTEIEISGKILTEHRAGDGTIFHVWHDFKNEKAVVLNTWLDGEKEPVTSIYMQTCGNRPGPGTGIAVYVDGWFVGYLSEVSAWDLGI